MIGVRDSKERGSRGIAGEKPVSSVIDTKLFNEDEQTAKVIQLSSVFQKFPPLVGFFKLFFQGGQPGLYPGYLCRFPLIKIHVR